MTSIPSPQAENPAPDPAAAKPVVEGSVFIKILHVVWMSIALGLFLQIVALLVSIFSGSLPAFPKIAAESMQKVSWSLFVCVALAIGTSTVKAMREAVSGMAGLLAAPIGFVLARSIHKAVGLALSMPPPAVPTAAPDVFILAGIKGFEFLVLGAVAGWLTKVAWADMKVYALLGFFVAIIFGGTIVTYNVVATVPAMAVGSILALSLNELLYPIGCALALYAGDALAYRLGAKE